MNRFKQKISNYTLLLSVICISGLNQPDIQARAQYPGKAGRHVSQVEPNNREKLKELAKTSDKKAINALASGCNSCCFNQTELGLIRTTEPVTEIRQCDIPIWITCPGTYKIVEDLFYDGDADLNNPNPAAAIYGPIGIGINAPNVTIEMNGHTLTYQGFAGNGIITYDTVDLEGNYIAQAHNAHIKNGSVIGNLDELSIGVALLSNEGRISNVTSALSENGLGVDTTVFVLDEENLAVDFTSAAVSGALLEHCYVTLNEVGIRNFGSSLSQMSIFNSTFDRNINGTGLGGQVSMDYCKALNSFQNGIQGSANNWNIKNTSVENSGTNGLVIVGSQNVLVSDTQVYNSGADGVIIGIREGKNVQLNRVQVFNANGILLRVDNINNFAANQCQFINYLQNPLPNNSPANPLVRIEDAFNATLSDSLLTSNSGTSDGCFIRNSQGVKCDTCAITLTSTESATHPNGFVFEGDVSSSSITNSSVTGLFERGISLTHNELNGLNRGNVFENNTIEGALEHGIFISQATDSILLGNKVARNHGNGITLDKTSSRSQVRDNTLLDNEGTGLSNEGCKNNIYHNFASDNGKNFEGVDLVSKPGKHVGVLDNISSK